MVSKCKLVSGWWLKMEISASLWVHVSRDDFTPSLFLSYLCGYDVDWLLFDVSNCLSYRCLDGDLHGAAGTSGAAVAAKHALEVASNAYHFLPSVTAAAAAIYAVQTVTDSIIVFTYNNYNNRVSLQQEEICSYVQLVIVEYIESIKLASRPKCMYYCNC